MPHKLKDPFRHKFSKPQYRPESWPDYDHALKQRGNLNVWLHDEAIAKWYNKPHQNKTPGRNKVYSDFCILAVRTLGTVFKQRLRQTEGFVESIIKLMRLPFEVPDHTTLCRRATNLEIPDLSSMLDSNEIINVVIDSTGLKIYGPSEWHQCKHRLKERRSWRKLHLVIATENNMIVCAELTTHDVGDPTPVPELLNAVNQDIGSIIGDGAYDSAEIYRFAKSRGAKTII